MNVVGSEQVITDYDSNNLAHRIQIGTQGHYNLVVGIQRLVGLAHIHNEVADTVQGVVAHILYTIFPVAQFNKRWGIVEYVNNILLDVYWKVRHFLFCLFYIILFHIVFRESFCFCSRITKRGAVWGFIPLRSPYVHENKVSTPRRLRLGVVGLAVNYGGIPSQTIAGIATILLVPTLALRILL